MTCSVTDLRGDVDLAAIRARYAQEREKRLRPEGNRQFIASLGERARLNDVDPFMPVAPRAPISEDIEVVILGGGFAGLLAGARLKERGIDDLRIIELGGDFGGTWYWNRYPGAQCDVESYTYLPLLEELGYTPKEKYSYGPEILDHCRRIGRHFRLYDGALFHTLVQALRWDDAIKRWRIETNRGDHIRARFLIMGNGFINRPKLPGIPGLDSFKGHSFHTSRWDYAYTGGDSNGELTKLHDKRVAVIGTGATAIQCIPYLGRHAKHLYVFQRTPSAVDLRGNYPTPPDFAATRYPGWQRDRQLNFDLGAQHGFRSGVEDLVCDGWTEINRNLADKFSAMLRGELAREAYAELRELEDHRVMERLRRRVDMIVEDKETAEKLKAWYRFACKRPTFNDEYLPTFNRRNVTLIDVSASKGVERMTPNGPVANGVEYPVDCIVYASGFEVTSELEKRIGIPVIEGRNGVSLYDNWRNGYQTLHGFTTHGFPNQFFVGVIQGGVGASITGTYDEQTRHIAFVIAETRKRGAASVEVSREAQDAWVNHVHEIEKSPKDFYQGCTPSYYNNEGDSTVFRNYLGDAYGDGFEAFCGVLEAWRNTGDLEGLNFE